jgi:hypothetical protein
VIKAAHSHITIYASNGNQVFDANTKQNVIKLSNLTKGVYLARIVDGANVSTVKFVY